ncbi:MAG: hypothetical protein ABI895_21505 [Deltaproteobacteria bacterium]
MSNEPPVRTAAGAVPAPASAETTLSPHPGAPPTSANTALDRTAHAIRVGTDAVALGLILYCGSRPELRAHGVVAFWIASLGVFPYPRVAEQLRQKRELPFMLLLTGAAIAFGSFGGLEPAIGKDAFLGLMLALVAWSVRLFVKAPPSEPVSPARLFVGVGALASGALYVWLGVQAAS